MNILNTEQQIKKSISDKNENYSQEILPRKIIQKYKFIDLFAGIGGFRLGMQRDFSECSFSCEWDKYASKHTSLILEKNLLEILMN